MSGINSNERFVRWQTVLRNQLTFLNNLLLTISIGVVGFLLTLLKDPYFEPTYCKKFFFTFGFILIFVSVLFGLLTAYSRLMDYRRTLEKIRTELRKEKGLMLLKKELMKKNEKLSWCFFFLQIFSFCGSILFLLIAFVIIYSNKLF